MPSSTLEKTYRKKRKCNKISSNPAEKICSISELRACKKGWLKEWCGCERLRTFNGKSKEDLLIDFAKKVEDVVEGRAHNNITRVKLDQAYKYRRCARNTRNKRLKRIKKDNENSKKCEKALKRVSAKS